MLDVISIFEGRALIRFFYKRDWTDLSKVQAIVDNKYDVHIKIYIKEYLMMLQQMLRISDKNICDLYHYQEKNDFFITYNASQKSKGISPLTEEPLSGILPEDHESVPFDYRLPCILSVDHQRARLEFCKDFLEHFQEDNFQSLSTMIIGIQVTLPYKCEKMLSINSEKEEYLYRSEEGRTRFVCFFDSLGIIYHKFLPESADAKLNGFQYVEILDEFVEHLEKYRSKCSDTENRCLMLENVWPHNSIAVKQFLAEKHICLIEYPIFSPDLSIYRNILFTHDAPYLYVIRKSNKLIIVKRFEESKSRAVLMRFVNRLQACIKSKGCYLKEVEHSVTNWNKED